MKFFIILLFSIYIAMATLAAPLLHFGNEIRVHESSDMAMSMESHNDGFSTLSLSDFISRCLRAASFFTTAVPSSPLVLEILAVLLLLCGALLRCGQMMFDSPGMRQFLEVRRRDSETIRYFAQRLFREWLALFELSPNVIAASSG